MSITGVADCCRPNCQGEGWPSPAIAAPAPTRAKSAQTMIANAAERLRTGILRIAPSNDGAPRADSVALQDPERGGVAPADLRVRWRPASAFAGPDRRKNPTLLKPQFQASRNASMRLGGDRDMPMDRAGKALLTPSFGHNALL